MIAKCPNPPKDNEKRRKQVHFNEKGNCACDNSDAGDGDIRIGKGLGGGGVTGGQWLQLGGMERGGRLRHTLLPTTGDTREFQVAT